MFSSLFLSFILETQSFLLSNKFINHIPRLLKFALLIIPPITIPLASCFIRNTSPNAIAHTFSVLYALTRYGDAAIVGPVLTNALKSVGNLNDFTKHKNALVSHNARRFVAELHDLGKHMQ